MEARPHVSILIATRDRAERLEACLKSLLALGGEEDREYLLVDNGSADATADILSWFQRACRWPVILLWEQVAGSGRALNRALTQARGDILIFTDDDCYAGRGLIAAYTGAFADPALGYAGGRILLHDPADSRLAIRECRTPERLAPHSFVSPGRIQGANMAFRREALLGIGGFDPDFGAGALFSGFDVDACARASDAGWDGAYVPDAVVSHHHGRRGAEARRQAARYARGGGAYFAKRLIEPPRRTRDLWTMFRFTIARRSLLAIARQIGGFIHYAALRMAGRLDGPGDPWLTRGHDGTGRAA